MARYRHPKHGFHDVGYGDDPAAFRAAGWALDEPAAPAPPVAAESTPAASVAAPLVPEPPPAPAPEPPAPPAPAPVIATPPTIRRGPGRPRRGY